MTSVCKWLGFYLCMKEPALNDKIRNDTHKRDMVVSLKGSDELCKENRGGLSFELILQPAIVDNPPDIVMRFTSLKGSISQEDIARKLKDAEHRRLSLEASKLQQLAKEKERVESVNRRVQEMNESFSRDSERKLAEKMNAFAEKKNSQIKVLRERLNQHAQRVEEVRKYGDQCRQELKEHIDRKLETAGEKREAQLTSIQERIRNHKKHIDEVIEQSSKFSKDTEEKILHKMESSIKNRDDQINHLLDRLRDHERRVQQVRQNKLNRSFSDEKEKESNSSMDDSSESLGEAEEPNNDATQSKDGHTDLSSLSNRDQIEVSA